MLNKTGKAKCSHSDCILTTLLRKSKLNSRLPKCAQHYLQLPTYQENLATPLPRYSKIKFAMILASMPLSWPLSTDRTFRQIRTQGVDKVARSNCSCTSALYHLMIGSCTVRMGIIRIFRSAPALIPRSEPQVLPLCTWLSTEAPYWQCIMPIFDY